MKGKVKSISAELSFGNFKKKELILITDEKYPQTLPIEFPNEKMKLLENVSVGDNVEISINVRGKEFTDKKGNVRHFVTLSAWKVQVLEDNLMDFNDFK